MFYVVGKKIYMSEPNETNQVYQEVLVCETEEGSLCLIPLETGLTEIPKKRKLCNTREILAQFGGKPSPIPKPQAKP